MKEAIKWWEAHRPTEYNLEDHLQNPIINCVTDAEKELAMAVSELIKKNQKIS
jgi:hypothetical protein